MPLDLERAGFQAQAVAGVVVGFAVVGPVGDLVAVDPDGDVGAVGDDRFVEPLFVVGDDETSGEILRLSPVKGGG